jgi:capsular exopolysaccharide synthesis family protein
MELRDYLRGLRRHWLAILLMTALGILTAFGWTLIQTPVYEATVNGLIQTKAAAEQGGGATTDPYAQAKIPTYLDMASWKVVAERAIDQLGSSASPDQIASRVTVVNPDGTAILKITAQGGSPQDAAALAQAWVDALAATIEEVDGASPASGQVNIYSAAAATVSSTPIFPDTTTALIVGGVLGLGGGVAFALMRTASDRRIRVADDVEARVHVPVVGTIPVSAAFDKGHRVFDLAGDTAKGGKFAVAESLRSLRTNLQFMDVDNPPRTIVVTSPLPGDGKSTIACNLAITLAQSGEAVVLIDGDLRRPKIAESMGLPDGAGLTDVLAGRAELPDVLQRSGSAPNLLVLTAGIIPPNPSEVLGSGRMRRLLSEVAEFATVIIDAPPLLPVTDGAVLTHQADGALLVVSVGRTTYDLVEKAVDTLSKAKGRVLGLVLNKAPTKGIDASPYAHEYRREYLASAAPANPSAPNNTEITPEPAPAQRPTGAASRTGKSAEAAPATGDGDSGVPAQTDGSIADLFGEAPVEASAGNRRRRGAPQA